MKRMEGSYKHIVLVHGSFHTGNCWNRLSPELQKIGFKTHILTLIGNEDKNASAFSVKLSDYVHQVIQKIESIKTPVILLGHSMGGNVISMVGEQCPDLVESMIYLAANVPRKKDRMIYMGKQPKEGDQSVFMEALKHSFGTLSKGRLGIDLELAKEAFYSEQPSDIQEKLVQEIVFQPIRPFFGKMEWTDKNLGAIPKSYIECTLDRAFPIAQQRTSQEHMKFRNVKTLESDHSPFLLMPEKLATFISELANQG